MAGSTSQAIPYPGSPPARPVNRRAPPPYVVQRRRYPRVNYRDPVCASAIGQPHHCWPLLAEDLSLGGLRLLSPEAFAVGTRLLLCLEPEITMEPIRAVAEVRWTARVDYQERYRLGLELVEMGEFERARLHSLVQAQAD
ncbi:PilZ domain-containing protein [Thiohalocapsa marina]|nr:PilZ domain-containing protein [Thiohalocapsa marina]